MCFSVGYCKFLSCCLSLLLFIKTLYVKNYRSNLRIILIQPETKMFQSSALQSLPRLVYFIFSLILGCYPSGSQHKTRGVTSPVFPYPHTLLVPYLWYLTPVLCQPCKSMKSSARLVSHLYGMGRCPLRKWPPRVWLTSEDFLAVPDLSLHTFFYCLFSTVMPSKRYLCLFF